MSERRTCQSLWLHTNSLFWEQGQQDAKCDLQPGGVEGPPSAQVSGSGLVIRDVWESLSDSGHQ